VPSLVRPGGQELAIRVLDSPIVTCEEAARAKGIPLAAELKSLFLVTSGGFILAHIRGSDRLSLRRVKTLFKLSEAYLAPRDILNEMHLSEGTISPFLRLLWELPQVVDKQLLDQPKVSTNAGTQHTYVEFSPRVLLSAPDATIADITQPVYPQ
jgi:prolyl-tRNA editing enzyme YbaK/EbsC (Cys-tRNA(Pro) deacylase)